MHSRSEAPGAPDTKARQAYPSFSVPNISVAAQKLTVRHRAEAAAWIRSLKDNNVPICNLLDSVGRVVATLVKHERLPLAEAVSDIVIQDCDDILNAGAALVHFKIEDLIQETKNDKNVVLKEADLCNWSKCLSSHNMQFKAVSYTVDPKACPGCSLWASRASQIFQQSNNENFSFFGEFRPCVRSQEEDFNFHLLESVGRLVLLRAFLAIRKFQADPFETIDFGQKFSILKCLKQLEATCFWAGSSPQLLKTPLKKIINQCLTTMSYIAALLDMQMRNICFNYVSQTLFSVSAFPIMFRRSIWTQLEIQNMYIPLDFVEVSEASWNSLVETWTTAISNKIVISTSAGEALLSTVVALTRQLLWRGITPAPDVFKKIQTAIMLFATSIEQHYNKEKDLTCDVGTNGARENISPDIFQKAEKPVQTKQLRVTNQSDFESGKLQNLIIQIRFCIILFVTTPPYQKSCKLGNYQCEKFNKRYNSVTNSRPEIDFEAMVSPLSKKKSGAAVKQPRESGTFRRADESNYTSMSYGALILQLAAEILDPILLPFCSAATVLTSLENHNVSVSEKVAEDISFGTHPRGKINGSAKSKAKRSHFISKIPFIPAVMKVGRLQVTESVVNAQEAHAKFPLKMHTGFLDLAFGHRFHLPDLFQLLLSSLEARLRFLNFFSPPLIDLYVLNVPHTRPGDAILEDISRLQEQMWILMTPQIDRILSTHGNEASMKQEKDSSNNGLLARMEVLEYQNIANERKSRAVENVARGGCIIFGKYWQWKDSLLELFESTSRNLSNGDQKGLDWGSRLPVGSLLRLQHTPAIVCSLTVICSSSVEDACTSFCNLFDNKNRMQKHKAQTTLNEFGIQDHAIYKAIMELANKYGDTIEDFLSYRCDLWPNLSAKFKSPCLKNLVSRGQCSIRAFSLISINTPKTSTPYIVFAKLCGDVSNLYEFNIVPQGRMAASEEIKGNHLSNNARNSITPSSSSEGKRTQRRSTGLKNTEGRSSGASSFVLCYPRTVWQSLLSPILKIQLLLQDSYELENNPNDINIWNRCIFETKGADVSNNNLRNQESSFISKSNYHYLKIQAHVEDIIPTYTILKLRTMQIYEMLDGSRENEQERSLSEISSHAKFATPIIVFPAWIEESFGASGKRIYDSEVLDEHLGALTSSFLRPLALLLGSNDIGTLIRQEGKDFFCEILNDICIKILFPLAKKWSSCYIFFNDNNELKGQMIEQFRNEDSFQRNSSFPTFRKLSDECINYSGYIYDFIEALAAAMSGIGFPHVRPLATLAAMLSNILPSGRWRMSLNAFKKLRNQIERSTGEIIRLMLNGSKLEESADPLRKYDILYELPDTSNMQNFLSSFEKDEKLLDLEVSTGLEMEASEMLSQLCIISWNIFKQIVSAVENKNKTVEVQNIEDDGVHSPLNDRVEKSASSHSVNLPVNENWLIAQCKVNMYVKCLVLLALASTAPRNKILTYLNDAEAEIEKAANHEKAVLKRQLAIINSNNSCGCLQVPHRDTRVIVLQLSDELRQDDRRKCKGKRISIIQTICDGLGNGINEPFGGRLRIPDVATNDSHIFSVSVAENEKSEKLSSRQKPKIGALFPIPLLLLRSIFASVSEDLGEHAIAMNCWRIIFNYVCQRIDEQEKEPLSFKIKLRLNFLVLNPLQNIKSIARTALKVLSREVSKHIKQSADAPFNKLVEILEQLAIAFGLAVHVRCFETSVCLLTIILKTNDVLESTGFCGYRTLRPLLFCAAVSKSNRNIFGQNLCTSLIMLCLLAYIKKLSFINQIALPNDLDAFAVSLRLPEEPKGVSAQVKKCFLHASLLISLLGLKTQQAQQGDPALQVPIIPWPQEPISVDQLPAHIMRKLITCDTFSECFAANQKLLECVRASSKITRNAESQIFYKEAWSIVAILGLRKALSTLPSDSNSVLQMFSMFREFRLVMDHWPGEQYIPAHEAACRFAGHFFEYFGSPCSLNCSMHLYGKSSNLSVVNQIDTSCCEKVTALKADATACVAMKCWSGSLWMIEFDFLTAIPFLQELWRRSSMRSVAGPSIYHALSMLSECTVNGNIDTLTDDGLSEIQDSSMDILQEEDEAAIIQGIEQTFAPKQTKTESISCFRLIERIELLARILAHASRTVAAAVVANTPLLAIQALLLACNALFAHGASPKYLSEIKSAGWNIGGPIKRQESETAIKSEKQNGSTVKEPDSKRMMHSNMLPSPGEKLNDGISAEVCSQNFTSLGPQDLSLPPPWVAAAVLSQCTIDCFFQFLRYADERKNDRDDTKNKEEQSVPFSSIRTLSKLLSSFNRKGSLTVSDAKNPLAAEGSSNRSIKDILRNFGIPVAPLIFIFFYGVRVLFARRQFDQAATLCRNFSFVAPPDALQLALQFEHLALHYGCAQAFKRVQKLQDKIQEVDAQIAAKADQTAKVPVNETSPIHESDKASNEKVIQHERGSTAQAACFAAAKPEDILTSLKVMHDNAVMDYEKCKETTVRNHSMLEKMPLKNNSGCAMLYKAQAACDTLWNSYTRKDRMRLFVLNMITFNSNMDSLLDEAIGAHLTAVSQRRTKQLDSRMVSLLIRLGNLLWVSGRENAAVNSWNEALDTAIGYPNVLSEWTAHDFDYFVCANRTKVESNLLGLIALYRLASHAKKGSGYDQLDATKLATIIAKGICNGSFTLAASSSPFYREGGKGQINEWRLRPLPWLQIEVDSIFQPSRSSGGCSSEILLEGLIWFGLVLKSIGSPAESTRIIFSLAEFVAAEICKNVQATVRCRLFLADISLATGDLQTASTQLLEIRNAENLYIGRFLENPTPYSRQFYSKAVIYEKVGPLNDGLQSSKPPNAKVGKQRQTLTLQPVLPGTRDRKDVKNNGDRKLYQIILGLNIHESARSTYGIENSIFFNILKIKWCIEACRRLECSPTVSPLIIEERLEKLEALDATLQILLDETANALNERHSIQINETGSILMDQHRSADGSKESNTFLNRMKHALRGELSTDMNAIWLIQTGLKQLIRIRALLRDFSGSLDVVGIITKIRPVNCGFSLFSLCISPVEQLDAWVIQSELLLQKRRYKASLELTDRLLETIGANFMFEENRTVQNVLLLESSGNINSCAEQVLAQINASLFSHPSCFVSILKLLLYRASACASLGDSTQAVEVYLKGKHFAEAASLTQCTVFIKLCIGSYRLLTHLSSLKEHQLCKSEKQKQVYNSLQAEEGKFREVFTLIISIAQSAAQAVKEISMGLWIGTTNTHLDDSKTELSDAYSAFNVSTVSECSERKDIKFTVNGAEGLSRPNEASEIDGCALSSKQIYSSVLEYLPKLTFQEYVETTQPLEQVQDSVASLSASCMHWEDEERGILVLLDLADAYLMAKMNNLDQEYAEAVNSAAFRLREMINPSPHLLVRLWKFELLQILSSIQNNISNQWKTRTNQIFIGITSDRIESTNLECIYEILRLVSAVHVFVLQYAFSEGKEMISIAKAMLATAFYIILLPNEQRHNCAACCFSSAQSIILSSALSIIGLALMIVRQSNVENTDELFVRSTENPNSTSEQHHPLQCLLRLGKRECKMIAADVSGAQLDGSKSSYKTIIDMAADIQRRHVGESWKEFHELEGHYLMHQVLLAVIPGAEIKFKRFCADSLSSLAPSSLEMAENGELFACQSPEPVHETQTNRLNEMTGGPKGEKVLKRKSHGADITQAIQVPKSRKNLIIKGLGSLRPQMNTISVYFLWISSDSIELSNWRELRTEIAKRFNQSSSNTGHANEDNNDDAILLTVCSNLRLDPMVADKPWVTEIPYTDSAFIQTHSLEHIKSICNHIKRTIFSIETNLNQDKNQYTLEDLSNQAHETFCIIYNALSKKPFQLPMWQENIATEKFKGLTQIEYTHGNLSAKKHSNMLNHLAQTERHVSNDSTSTQPTNLSSLNPIRALPAAFDVRNENSAGYLYAQDPLASAATESLLKNMQEKEIKPSGDQQGPPSINYGASSGKETILGVSVDKVLSVLKEFVRIFSTNRYKEKIICDDYALYTFVTNALERIKEAPSPIGNVPNQSCIKRPCIGGVSFKHW